VYLTLPYGPAAWRGFVDLVGPASEQAAAAVMLMLAGATLRRYRDVIRGFGSREWIAVALSSAVWIFGATSPDLTPAEKTHFITYGALAWVVLRALDIETSAGWRYPLAALIVGGLGGLDEGIQYVLPRRHFEWKDVVLNLVSGAVALLVVAALRGDLRSRSRR
jgi:VanZ family protein